MIDSIIISLGFWFLIIIFYGLFIMISLDNELRFNIFGKIISVIIFLPVIIAFFIVMPIISFITTLLTIQKNEKFLKKFLREMFFWRN